MKKDRWHRLSSLCMGQLGAAVLYILRNISDQG